MKINLFIPFILLLIVVLFSLGKTLQYHFYTDDYAFLYYLRNNFEFGWPYNHVLTIFRPVFNLFQINPLPYFSVAVFTYFFASIAVYFFIKSLTQNKLLAFLSSLIFATGYIGIDSFTMIAVSIINNLNVVNICLTLIALIYWVKTKKLRYYLLTLLMFWLSVSIFPYRAFSLILFIPTIEVLMGFQFASLQKIIRQFVLLVVRYIPFVLIASEYGIFSYGTHTAAGSTSRFSLLESSALFSRFNLEFFKELFAILGRFVLAKPISDILKFAPDQAVYSYIGLVFFLVVTLTAFIFLFSKNSRYARSLLVALFLAMEGYIAYMFLAVNFDANGPFNRYLATSFLFFSAVFPLFFFLVLEKISSFKHINKKWVLVATIVPVILLFSSMSRNYEDGIIENRSIPSKSFFKQLKAYVPTLSDSNYHIFYFDNALYHPVASRFGSVLLSAAMSKSVNLATPYGISMDNIKIVDTFDEFLRLISNPLEGKKISYYTFYVDEKRLHNTTGRVFVLLKNGSIASVSDKQISQSRNQGSSVITIEPENVSSLTPLQVRLTLKATPLPASSFTFPYIGVDAQQQHQSVKDYYQNNNIQKAKIFRYLLARERYYKSVNVDVESIHIGKQNPGSFLTDDNANTSWLSDQSRWEVDIKPWIKIDMGETRNISKILWRHLPNRVITKFTVETSMDADTWSKVENVRQGDAVLDVNLVTAEFPETNARYIRFTINNLATGKSPGPGLTELEVIENEFSDVDLDAALRVKDNPFEYVKDIGELEETYSYLSQNAKLKIKSMTNRDDPASNVVLFELPFAMDSMSHEHTFQLSPGGTLLKNIKLEANLPANFSIENVTIENLSQIALDQQIKQKCQSFEDEKDYANPFNCK